MLPSWPASPTERTETTGIRQKRRLGPKKRQGHGPNIYKDTKP
jgi:hypothetical protein